MVAFVFLLALFAFNVHNVAASIPGIPSAYTVSSGNKNNSVFYLITPCGTKIPYTNKGYSCVYGDYGSYTAAKGYTCSYSTNGSAYSTTFEYMKCTKTIPASYTTSVLNNYSLRGVYTAPSATTVTAASDSTWNDPSPYLYFYNAPVGTVSASLDSSLDIFSPKPAFTRTATWDVVVSIDKKLQVADAGVDHLFYRLAIDTITLSRNGRNFETKEELLSFIASSDFLDTMGFSEVEKANSLKTITEDVHRSPESEYYYLTVLDDSSVHDLSDLVIDPEPTELVRRYFAVYPSSVPVKTEGDIVFPEIKSVANGEYYVKETGELLLTNNTVVKFK